MSLSGVTNVRNFPRSFLCDSVMPGGRGQPRGWRKNFGSDTPDNYRQSMWNGYGTTKTKPSSTLFVGNIPAAAWFERVEIIFLEDEGVCNVREAKRNTMMFVDYEDVQSATKGMLRHQNHCFPGVEKNDGLCIDFDKDPDKKRNLAHAKDMKARQRQLAQGSASRSKKGHIPVFPPCIKCRDTTH
ncbi:hypothetical protein CYMTET_29029, partial [Cymbomonas tetramitiformis]